ncbi:MAG: FAD-dependent oxidoreductase, partial [Acidihalobacter sp.]
MRPVVVVGAGWAGLAAAVELSAQGLPVTLLEAAPVPGGRARSVQHSGRTFDNGQHLLLGAYRDTRALLARLGVREADMFARMPLELCMHDAEQGALHLRAGHLPGRLHLAQA